MKNKSKAIASVVSVILAVVVYLTGSSSIEGLFNSITSDIKSDTAISTTYNGNFKVYEDKEAAIDALNKLTISEKDESVDYSGDVRNDQYGGWQNHNGTNTRIEVLKQQASNYEEDSNGKIVSGTWYIPYSGETVAYNKKEDISKNIQIDHVIPVSYAHRHGAASWDEDKKHEFYNDYGVNGVWSEGTDGKVTYNKVGNLIVSDSKSNISKSDKGPSEWLPSNEDYVLNYLEQWVVVASNYGISISQADYDVIYSAFNNAN